MQVDSPVAGEVQPYERKELTEKDRLGLRLYAQDLAIGYVQVLEELATKVVDSEGYTRTVEGLAPEELETFKTTAEFKRAVEELSPSAERVLTVEELLAPFDGHMEDLLAAVRWNQPPMFHIRENGEELRLLEE